MDNFVHALSGSHMETMPTHTCVTSLVRGGVSDHGRYRLELVPRMELENAYSVCAAGEERKKEEEENSVTATKEKDHLEIRLSQHHLPPVSTDINGIFSL